MAPTRTPPPRLLFTVDESVNQLAISRVTFYGLLRSGELKSVKIGRSRRIAATELARYIDSLSDG